jgi:hypothetical protein
MKKNGRLDDEPPVFFFADFRRVAPPTTSREAAKMVGGAHPTKTEAPVILSEAKDLEFGATSRPEILRCAQDDGCANPARTQNVRCRHFQYSDK